jgi:hypothetical protein
VEKERENEIDMGKGNGDRIFVPGQNRRMRNGDRGGGGKT